jgi:zinc finger protein
MATTEVHPAFSLLSADDVDNQLTEIESLCMNCYAQGQTRLLLTRIPYYKDVIISSFECAECNFKNNDVQPAQRVEAYGILLNCHVMNSKDLNRQFVKSNYGIIRIKELDFEQAPFSENGLLTTIEGSLEVNLKTSIK